jgi:arabinose-5-phosphate isomerase
LAGVLCTPQLVTTARAVLEAEARALLAAADRLDGSLSCAAELILSHSGKVVVTGIGKSGHIGHKLAATLCSTGTPAVFLHATEAVHGDLGMYSPGDPTIFISKNGATAELLRLVPILRNLESATIGILGNLVSPLAREVNVVLDARVEREADPWDLAPTSSTTVALAIGDALAVALMAARRFTPSDFARFHPAGQLGRSLRLRVADVMHTGDQVAWAAANDPLKQVVILMTRHPLGAACVIDEQKQLLGLITDGDLRRALQTHEDIRGLYAADVMTANPIRISPEANLKQAANLMENRPSQISVLPVVETDGRCKGLVRVHDIYQSSLI